ncbi:rad17 checkpoint clamp loader component isoform X2 [Nomia melanderi]|uniref:rad17 checkpoint clamp loader component isoform X2 n=1 Tax=Nomia melanderi TaxID=2448451 RepID=UPI001304624A|nr:cell cycle checkpoint protein RAD17 isoform X2 [Nomia melanderi]
MANSKKNSSWLMPSFDGEFLNKSPAIKRKSSQILEKSVSNVSMDYDIIPKKKSTNSLSILLEASEPQKPSELVVSRQKQQEITDWLRYKVKRGKPSVLILTGPAGCGKTAAIRLLSKENGFDIAEWITPVDQAMDENNRIMRQGDRFEDFVIRVTRYSSVLNNYHSRLLLVKDFPNVFIEDKDAFLSFLERYFEIGKEPIVFVCTEIGNSKLLQTLFPSNIREKFDIDLININPVTQAAMKNSLKRIGDIFNSVASHIICVSQDKIEEILSNSIGDIRNAVINLIFISLKVPKGQEENKCNIREESLGLLHGVGRVINPKRIQTENSWKFVHDPDDIASYFQSQSTVFLSFLQENYLNTMRGIEEVNACANILSLADTLNSEWRDLNLTNVTLSFCIRGVMVMNEKPISGWNPVRKPANVRIEMRRCLAAAEVRWYESIINSKSKHTEELLDIDMEAIIE